jgi:hypothetical protein
LEPAAEGTQDSRWRAPDRARSTTLSGHRIHHADGKPGLSVMSSAGTSPLSRVLGHSRKPLAPAAQGEGLAKPWLDDANILFLSRI